MNHIMLTRLQNGCTYMVITLTGLESKVEDADTLYSSILSYLIVVSEPILNECHSTQSISLVLIHSCHRSASLKCRQLYSRLLKSNE